MKVQKRGTDAKRHTIGYLVGNKWRTRKQVWELAKAGKIDNVVACKGEYGGYIQSHPMSSTNTKLYNLPSVVRV